MKINKLLTCSALTILLSSQAYASDGTAVPGAAAAQPQRIPASIGDVFGAMHSFHKASLANNQEQAAKLAVAEQRIKELTKQLNREEHMNADLTECLVEAANRLLILNFKAKPADRSGYFPLAKADMSPREFVDSIDTDDILKTVESIKAIVSIKRVMAEANQARKDLILGGKGLEIG